MAKYLWVLLKPTLFHCIFPYLSIPRTVMTNFGDAGRNFLLIPLQAG